MKYPERLSPERLFFLTKEERAIYESEWAEHLNKQDNDITINDTEYVNEQVDSIYQDLFNDIISETHYNEFKKLLDEEIKYFNETSQLTDNQVFEGAEGVDHMKWLQGVNVKGFGKLFLAGLGLLGTGIALLATNVRDRLAMIKLKKFMNRMVEVIDQGIKKKRSFLSKMFNWKWRGEHNVACFRFIQETADRNMALGVMQAAKKLGYFAPGQMQNIASGANPQEGGGLSDFNNNVLSKLNFLVPETPDVSIPSRDNS
jgi:hypothetical protein